LLTGSGVDYERGVVVDAERERKRKKEKNLLSEKKEVCSNEFDRADIVRDAR
jgi:hypothetical protein